MTWFNLLKMVPSEKVMLAYVLVNRKQTDKMLAEVAALTKEPKELRSLLRTIKGNNPSLEEVIQRYSNTPHADLELDEIKANVVKLEEAINEMMVGLKDMPFKTIQELKIMVDKGIIARDASDDVQVKEILAEIDRRNTFSRQKMSSYRDIRDKLDVLRIKSDQPYLSFEGFPDNSKILQDFAKLLEQEFKNNIILVDYSSINDFILSMTPKTKKTGKGKKMVVTVVDDKPTLDKKTVIQNFYKKNISGKKWAWNDDGNKTDLNDKVAAKKIFVASNTKLSLNGTFTTGSVFKYIKAVDATGGSVAKFKPDKFPNGSNVPQVLLLSKSSVNAMNLNPYAKMLLTNVLTGNWFKKLFENIRMNQMITEEEAEMLVINDIYLSIRAVEGKSKYGISATDLKSIKNSIVNVGTKKESVVKQEIRALFNDSAALQARIYLKTLNLRKEQFLYLKDNFTIKEAKSFEAYYRELVGNDEDDIKLLKIEYFKNGVPVADKVPKLVEGKNVVDEAGATIMETRQNAEKANYAKITIDKETVTPDTAYKEDFTVSSGSKSKRTKEQTAKTIAKLKKVLAKTKKLKSTKKDQEGVEVKLANLERDIKEAEERLTNSTSVDMGAATSRLRNDLLNTSSFQTYVLDMALKLKDEGGLTKLISTSDRSASVYDQISAERSLNFLGFMADHANNDEVGKAFKTIDSDPESDNAKLVVKQLDEAMPNLLTEMTKQIVGAFELKLKDFASNPAQFPDKQVMAAKFQFVEKYNLLKVGE